jgi:hypothetical protein
MRRYDIVPEFSFVLGSPTESVDEDLEQDIDFICRVKKVNPASEIVIYVYSPVHFQEAELFHAAERFGFEFPRTLDDWLSPAWQLHDLRRSPVTPWLTRKHVRTIRNFERVLNSYSPTLSDLKLTSVQRRLLHLLGSWRYSMKVYHAPMEVAAMQRLFRYRQPETEGF